VYSGAGADIVARWQFDEGQPNSVANGTNSIVDSSGNGHNGTPVGGPIYRTSWSANTGRSLQFDAVDDRVFVPESDSFRTLNSLSIEAVVRLNGVPNSCCNLGMILFRGDDRPGLDPWYLAYDGGGRLIFSFDDDHGNRTFILTPQGVPLGSWVHVAGTLDSVSGWMRLYINRCQVAAVQTAARPSQLPLNSTGGVGIGGSQSSAINLLAQADIDEVRIHNVALARSEMMAGPCHSDFNGDGQSDLFDYLDFVDAFAAQSLAADFNYDGVVDFFDYLDFVDSFAAGCA
jgi:hypothetical protein